MSSSAGFFFSPKPSFLSSTLHHRITDNTGHSLSPPINAIMKLILSTS